MVSTPTVELMVPHLEADAGIIITASHNPAEWNALKFLNKEGVFLNESEVEKLNNIVENRDFHWSDYRGLRSSSVVNTGNTLHISSILKLPFIKPGMIRKRKIKVAYDGVNGAGSDIVPKLLSRLGCKVHAINVEPDGFFPHDPEPTPKNLKQLGKVVKEKKCDVGFATDPDADRCAIINEEGRAISEEYTLVLAARLILGHKKGPMTVNLSSSRMNEDLARQFGIKLFRTKVGEAYVVSGMKENKSVIGGEGNGGVILPDIHYGRDGILAIALLLQLMAQEKKSITELTSEIPSYYIEKQKISINDKSIANIYGRLLAKFRNVKRDERDGLRFEWERKWVHIRASNTEPVIRVIAEAPKAGEARELCAMVAAEI
jgi:phosphomannomutase